MSLFNSKITLKIWYYGIPKQILNCNRIHKTILRHQTQYNTQSGSPLGSGVGNNLEQVLEELVVLEDSTMANKVELGPVNRLGLELGPSLTLLERVEGNSTITISHADDGVLVEVSVGVGVEDLSLNSHSVDAVGGHSETKILARIPK